MTQQTELFSPAAPDPEDSLTLAHFAQRAYLDYAVSVVKGRALPDVADGQKPVQRRILYAMHSMGLGPGSKHVKSARVVGDVIGKFHPHGDQAAYDALVRMAQEFSLRYPLIDGQGNYGSRDDDPAAAMRYTEARLTPIARLLLDELDQGTVDFLPNYDGSQQEPRLLPARLPMVLLNGASGIAVGMATEIPSHNLREVVRAAQLLLRQPKATLGQLLEHLRGPDFPGGGQVISSDEEIRAIYEGGRGSLKLRARWRFEELARGQWQLVVTELPPGTSARRVQEEIEELINPKVRAGRKSLTPEQQQTKQIVLSVLDRMRDESSRDAAVRLVFEPRTSKIERQELVNTLLAHTSLEGNVAVNLVMIGRDGRPCQKTLIGILHEWLDFRVETVRRRSRHRLDRVLDRIHVLEGRQTVLLHIDRVIKLIRNSDQPKPDLMRVFRLTDRQAEDILELRLRQLARLEAIRLEQELAELKKDEGALRKLLDSESALRRQVGKELEEDAQKHGDERRTLIESAEPTTFEVKVLDEPVTVIVSTQGFVRSRNGHGHDAAQFAFKAGDSLYGAFECRTVDYLVAIGSNGRCYSVPVANLPSARGDGLPVTSMIELEPGTRLVTYVAGGPGAPLLLSTSAGTGFACQLGDLLSRQRGGKQFLTLEAGVEPLRPAQVDPDTDDRIACVSESGRMLVFPAVEIRAQSGGGRGVIFLGLNEGERMIGALSCGETGVVVSGTSPRSGKPSQVRVTGSELATYAGNRARKGILLTPRIRPLVVAKPEPAAS
ncbi:MAG TPA: DNA topoisomerase IV subunit A [Burkholderiaceae bacterium]|nr:DNA topoisomerase IV subunit A [Burkholderiaceae bacterium]